MDALHNTAPCSTLVCSCCRRRPSSLQIMLTRLCRLGRQVASPWPPPSVLLPHPGFVWTPGPSAGHGWAPGFWGECMHLGLHPMMRVPASHMLATPHMGPAVHGQMPHETARLILKLTVPGPCPAGPFPGQQQQQRPGQQQLLWAEWRSASDQHSSGTSLPRRL